MEIIRRKACGKKIWVSLDETTDVEQRCIVNLVFGVLGDETERGKYYLVNVGVLSKVNHSTVAGFFNDSLQLLWPTKLEYENFLLVCTDAAPYMCKAMNGLQVLFKEIAPSTPLLPSPVVTRWGSWIDAATYYGKNFDVIEAVIATFDPEEAQSIQESKILLETEGMKESLLFIATNFACISSTITRLEERGLLLSSAISLVNGVLDELKSLQSDAYYGKLSNVLYKNKGFVKLKKVSQIMCGEAIIDETVQPLTMSNMLCMKHAPIVSCDVEKVFSEYKAMLTDNRRSFNFENLRHHVIIKCNHNL
ncbi:hypothetical protein Pcinc_000438 [Petrolisthes cinctipes]|uniref:DUF659 domain-containing protein n=1 Tax=Petrolisthes cinctipes TaxID=88211 RepID=A0AAE1L4T7_PETCI|nr:hypothetical protein Pcinc_000438 [Petrolisthes cinctipes]